MTMIQVSKDLERATNMNAEEISRELAVHLYAQGKLSAGKARQLANMTAYAFQCLLGARGISANYDAEDFLDDLKTIERLKLDQ